MNTGFSPILQALVAAVPGSIGAVFADAEGEVIEMHPLESTPGAARNAGSEAYDLLVLGAQVGVLYALAQAVMGLFHFGSVESMVLAHSEVDVVVHGVGNGTYVILASPAPAQLARAMRAIDRAAADLAREMG